MSYLDQGALPDLAGSAGINTPLNPVINTKQERVPPPHTRHKNPGQQLSLTQSLTPRTTRKWSFPPLYNRVDLRPLAQLQPRLAEGTIPLP